VGELGPDELGVAVALGVVGGEDLARLLLAVLGDEPSGALRDEAVCPWLVGFISASTGLWREALQDRGYLE
jgi:hypothetical protein